MSRRFEDVSAKEFSEALTEINKDGQIVRYICDYTNCAAADLFQQEKWREIPGILLVLCLQPLLKVLQRLNVDIDTVCGRNGLNLLQIAVSLSNQSKDPQISSRIAAAMAAYGMADKEIEKWEVIKKLLHAGASPNCRDENGDLPLTTFTKQLISNPVEDWEERIKLIFPRDGHINDKNHLGETPLQVFLGNLPAVGCDPDLAITEERAIAIIDLLVQYGATVQMSNLNGESILYTAVQTMSTRLVAQLARHGARDMPREPLRRVNPLHRLLTEKLAKVIDYTIYKEMITTLVWNANVDVNAASMDGARPIHLAAANFPVEFSQHLVSLGAETDRVDVCQRTVLHYAVSGNPDGKVAEYFLTMGYSPDVTDCNRYTPLHRGCTYIQSTASGFLSLVDHGANVSAKAKGGIQPIHLICTESSLKCLLNAGADINAKDAEGRTLLHSLAMHRQSDLGLITIALRYGADRTMEDFWNCKPVDYAIQEGHMRVAQLLMECPTNQPIAYGVWTVFPDQGPYTLTDADTYFTRLKNDVEGWTVLLSEALSMIRHTPSLGHVQTDMQPFAETVKHEVGQFLESVVKQIGELDPRFAGSLIKAGSMHEGTKVGKPNELDFLVDLTLFSAAVQHYKCTDLVGFVEAHCLVPFGGEMRDFFMPDGRLKSAKVLSRFIDVGQQAWKEVSGMDWPHIMADESAWIEATPDKPFHTDTLFNRVLLWLDGPYNYMQVSIDLNPVISCSGWPGEARQNTPLLCDIDHLGFKMIPKGTSIKSEHPRDLDRVCVWRLSLSHIETKIFQSLPTRLLELFAFIKAIRSELVCPTIKTCFEDDDDELYGDVPTTALSEIQVRLLGFDPDHEISEKDFDNNESENDDSDDTEHMGMGNTYPEEWGMESPQMFEEDKSDASSESGWNLDISYSGEQLLPTFYLKQLFLPLAESLVNTELTDRQLVEYTITIYKQLQEAIEAECIKNYLIPTQNIYSTLTKTEDGTVDAQHMRNFINTVRKMYCRNVIQLLEVVLKKKTDG